MAARESRLTASMLGAYELAWRSDYTDRELLLGASAWQHLNPALAWQWREAWAIRCVEGRHGASG